MTMLGLEGNIFKKIKDSNNRSSLIAKNIFGTFLLKGITIPTQFLLVPLTINYVSSELYGIWLTLTSIIGWVGFFDIGFGNGMRNRLAESLAVDDITKGRKYISTTYACMLAIFVSVAVIGCIIVPYINWPKLLNVSVCYQDTIVKVVRIVLVCFCVQMILKVQTFTWMALQMNAVASACAAFGDILTLVSIWILTLTVAPSLVNLALVFNIASLFSLIAFSLYLFLKKRPDLSPSLLFIERGYAKDILSLGGKFFVIQIAAIVSYQMVNVIISNTCGAEAVTEYNVVYKYVNIPNMIFTMLLTPMWSAYTDAYANKDETWMMNTYNKLRKMFLVALLSVVLLFAVHPIFFKYWIGDSVEIHWSTVAILSVYILALIWGNMHGAIINGMGKLKFSMLFVNFQTICTIPLAFYLGSKFGLDGAIFGFLIVVLPGVFTGPYQTINLIRGTAKGIWNK